MTFIGIDPSTKTGLVVLTSDGDVLVEQEIMLKDGKKSTIEELRNYGIRIAEMISAFPNAKVAIEGFAYAAKGDAVSLQYAIGYAIRFALYDARISYYEPTPSALKKFVGGKGNSKKEVIIKEVYKRWGYEHDSNNVIDAYALAQLARAQESAHGG